MLPAMKQQDATVQPARRSGVESELFERPRHVMLTGRQARREKRGIAQEERHVYDLPVKHSDMSRG